MSHLSDWSEAIRRQGEESRAREDKRLDAMEVALPGAIKLLSSQTNEEVLTLFEQFGGSVFSHRENTIRETFHDAARAEILKRMK